MKPSAKQMIMLVLGSRLFASETLPTAGDDDFQVASQVQGEHDQHNERCTLCNQSESAHRPLLYCRGCTCVCHTVCLKLPPDALQRPWFCAVCKDAK